MENMVYLIGAGPGDIGLITVKGLECIRKADVVIYDQLANERFLDEAPETAEKIYVGKKAGCHALPQDKINELIAEKAKLNKIVVRLKGGDPYVFGRGGEEAIHLLEENIPFEVVPGISSSISAPAYAGIPVTHRAIATSFHVITGHEDPTKEEESVDYEALARVSGTLIFLMGFGNLEKICSELIKFGKPPETPAAVVYKGTSPEQKVVSGNLNNIVEKSTHLSPPSIIVVGEVVNLRDQLNWFEKKPLFGRKILVTRSRHQASTLVNKIQELGGSTVEFPTIEIKPNSNTEQLISMYESLKKYNWLIFTSVNSVEIFFENLKKYNFDIRDIGTASICAIGKVTQEAIEKRLLKVDVTPPDYIAEALIECLKDKITKGDKVLIPRADVAREILPEQLKEFRAEVDVVPLYETIIPTNSRENLIKRLKKVDTITFTSSSTVSNFLEILGKDHLNLLENKRIASIGSITTETALKAGLSVTKTAGEHTIDGLVKTLLEL